MFEQTIYLLLISFTAKEVWKYYRPLEMKNSERMGLAIYNKMPVTMDE